MKFGHIINLIMVLVLIYAAIKYGPIIATGYNSTAQVVRYSEKNKTR